MEKIVCFKEGHTDETIWSKQETNEEPRNERARGEVRTGCKSKILVVNEKTGPGCIVSTFKESHNHPLPTLSKMYLLHSSHIVSTSKKAPSQ